MRVGVGICAVFGGWAIVGYAALAAASSWPADDPNLSGRELARPDLQPNDPAFAPWVSGGRCEGQTHLYGFRPPCAGAGDNDAPTGAAVDRAWLLSVGDPTVNIAVISDGVDLADPRLAPQIRLDPGEIPAPPDGPHDRNGDGVLTVVDFTSATSTQAATVDRIVDPRLLARPDRGDVDGDGRLSPADLLVVFSDGVDDDGDGLVDDIAGWDFLANDNEAQSVLQDVLGHRAALGAAERGDDGEGGIGTCPRCTVLPLRVGARGLADPNRAAYALLYAVEQGASVAAIVAAVPGETPFWSRARARATARGLVGVIEAGTATSGPSLIEAAPLFGPGFLLAEASGYSGPLAATTKTDVPLSCRRGSLGLDGVFPGARCTDAAPAGWTAGLLGLLVDVAQRGSRDRPPPSPTPSPEALVSALLETSEPLADEIVRSPLQGKGAFRARAALEHVLEGSAVAAPRWRSPTQGHLLDPTRGSAQVVVEIGEPGDERWSWTLSVGRGLEPARLEVVASGQNDAPGVARIDTRFDIEGLVNDPVATPTSLGGRALTLRFTASTQRGSRRVAASTDRVVFLGTDLDLLPGFPIELGSGAWAGPRIVDGDGDGEPEIWVSLLDGRLMAIEGRSGEVSRVRAGRPAEAPNGLSRWAGGGVVPPDVPLLGAPSARRVNGGYEVGAVGADGVLVTDAAARPPALGEPAAPTEDAPAGHVAIPLALPSGDEEVFVWPGANGIWRADREGGSAELWQRFDEVPSPLVLATRGENPVVWARLQTALVSSDGQSVEAEAPEVSGMFRLRPAAPVVSDPDGGGRSIFARVPSGLVWVRPGTAARTLPFSSRSSPLALSSNGAALIGWGRSDEDPLRIVTFPATSGARGQLADLDPSGAEVAVVDVDGGAPEWVFGGDAARLFAISEDGRPAAGWPKATGDPVMGTPAVGDLDGDGRLELAAVTRSGRVFVWRTRGLAERARWAGSRHDLGATANPEGPLLPAPATGGGGCRGVHISGGRLSPPALLWLGTGLLALRLRRRGSRRAGGRRRR